MVWFFFYYNALYKYFYIRIKYYDELKSNFDIMILINKIFLLEKYGGRTTL